MTMQSIIDADNNHAALLAAMAEGRAAREAYVTGIVNQVGDDALRHLHHDAMAAAAKSEKIAGQYMGIRKVEYAQ